jgi:elongator complex protein 1
MTRYTGRSDGTLNTQTTHRTSKNKRREERKRARGKKGTIYEEEYLVNSLTRLIERVNSVNEDVSRLVDALMRRGKREEAKVVERTMNEVVELCNTMSKEVYEQSSETKQRGEDEPPRPTGGDAVLADALETAQMPKIAPIIKKFERLSLLQ